ncbi:ribose-5-phosphate isomerase RpiA [Pararhodobacter sp. SW119]|uniref:ribose-5-phosphate isomerase RpiA n=1 Tax=Pararhodobacter sp. SW119 TaxID=2780075 RepID=UPI001ADFB910|nr:ribose-5-phosphate isomerase RpiA [Pararhodobacter sp. SW119]
MTKALSPSDRAKAAAAKRSVAFVEDGMKLGLGTGSTAALMVRALADLARSEGLTLTCVATSSRTADQARQEGLKVVTLDEAGRLDLTIDGADEFDADFSLIKGGGGAHLQEKIVAAASERMIVITDASKEVKTLGAFPLPVEVIGFGWTTTQTQIEELLAGMDVMGTGISRRMAGETPFRTDEGNFILDLALGRIGNARALSQALNQIPGVVENGLFLGLCDTIVIGHSDGRVETRDLNAGTVHEENVLFEESSNIFREL